MELATCYRLTGPKELKLLEESGYKRWPPRLPEKPIFYPVTNQKYVEGDHRIISSFPD